MSTSLWENIRREDDLTRRVCAVVFKKDLVVVENELSAHLTDKRLSSSITKAWDEWEIYEQSAFEEMGITGPSQTGMISPNDNLSYEQKMNLLSVQLELEKYRSINGSNVSNATSEISFETTDVEMFPVDDAKSQEENRLREMEVENAKLREQLDILERRDRANLSNLSASRILVRRVFIHERFRDVSGSREIYFRYPPKFKNEADLYEPILNLLENLGIRARKADHERLGDIPPHLSNAIFQRFRIGGSTDLRLQLMDVLIEVKVSKRVAKLHKSGRTSPNTTQLPSASPGKRRGSQKLYPTTASQVQVVKQALTGSNVAKLQRLSANKETNGLSAHLPQGLGQLILSQLAAPNSTPCVLITSFDRNDKSIILFFANRDAVIDHFQSMEDKLGVALDHRMDVDDEEDDAEEEWKRITNVKARLKELCESSRDRVNEHVAVVSTISYEKMIAILRNVAGKSTGWDLFDKRTPATSDHLSLFNPSISSSTTSGGDSSKVLWNAKSPNRWDRDSEPEPEPKQKKTKKKRTTKRTGSGTGNGTRNGKGNGKGKKKKKKKSKDSMTCQVGQIEEDRDSDLVILNEEAFQLKRST